MSKSKSPSPCPLPRVIVVGAGMSGLACARELQHRRYSVLVVEGRKDRLGGRLWGESLCLQTQKDDNQHNNHQINGGTSISSSSSDHDKVHVDLGGALIHGITDNPLFQLTQQMGVPTRQVSDCLLLDAHGWPVDPKQDDKLSGLFNDCLEESFRMAAAQPEKHDTNPSDSSSSHDESKESFGSIWNKVVQDKQLSSASNLLFQWHQANLEVSCGASLDQLGYTWNDDEPYGFDGAHVALEPSWKEVVEGLAEGLDIVQDSPVTCIRIVKPKNLNPHVNETNGINATAALLGSRPARRQTTTTTTSSTTTTSTSSTTATSTVPTRRSRRLLGEDAHVRRSNRSNKGIPMPALQISLSNSLSYNGPLYHPPVIKAKQPTQSPQPSPIVQVVLANGTVLEADAVVCTLPLGILKLPPHHPNHVQFDPPLPMDKQSAIQQLGCGLLNKCALSFPHVFWQDSEFLGVVDDPPRLILNASVVTGQPVLIFLMGGTHAQEMEHQTDAQIVDMCLKVLHKLCHAPVPDPVDFVVTRWGQDVHARGAFVYIPPGVEGMTQLEIMGQPIMADEGENDDKNERRRPLILFAGEHTTPYHPSTIHGAFLSGIREAYRLDLALEPTMNNYLEFEADHLYQKTFSVKKRQPPPGSAAAPSPKTTSTTTSTLVGSPPPRRRRNGVMTLRNKIHSPSTPTQSHVNGSARRSLRMATTHSSYANGTTLTSTARKSLRMTKTEPMNGVVLTNSNHHRQQGQPQEEEQQQLDRTLLRSYDNYRDWKLLETVMGHPAPYLRERYRQLEKKSHRPKTEPTNFTSWVASNNSQKRETTPAKHVTELSPMEPQRKKQKEEIVVAHRKSQRTHTPRVMFDM